MKNLLTNFVVVASLASLATATGCAKAENTVPSNAALPAANLQTPNTGPGTVTESPATARAVTPMSDVANDTTTTDMGNNAPAKRRVSTTHTASTVPVTPVPATQASVPEPNPSGDLTATALAKIHHVNQMEIEMGKLAMEKAESRDVRAYAERLVRDHQMSDRKLMAFANGKNIPVENFPVFTAAEQAKEKEVADQLHALTGASFDRVYLQKMAEGHSDTINDISLAIDQLPDRAERNFLAKIRPIVGQHERLANILLSRKPS